MSNQPQNPYQVCRLCQESGSSGARGCLSRNNVLTCDEHFAWSEGYAAARDEIVADLREAAGLYRRFEDEANKDGRDTGSAWKLCAKMVDSLADRAARKESKATLQILAVRYRAKANGVK